MHTLTVEKQFLDALLSSPNANEFEKILLLNHGFDPDKPYAKTIHINGDYIYKQNLPPVEIITVNGKLKI